jgi:O-antigen/teichoic acid export membrane protein
MGDDSNITELSSSLKSISQGAGLFLIGKFISQIIGFILNIILTRTLGTSLYGIYTYLDTVFSLVYVFTTLGGDKSILRYLPEYSDDSRMQSVMLSIAYITSLTASIIVASFIYYLAPLISSLTLDQPLFVDVIQVGCLILPFNTMANITQSSFKAIERMDYEIAISSIAKPIFRLIFVGGAVLLGYSVIGAVAGLIVTSILAFIIALYILIQKTDLGYVKKPSVLEAKRYYNFSLPLTFNHLGSFLYNRVDIIMVGILLSSSTVGIYNVAVIISGILALPLTAFNQLFAPIASKLYSNNEYEELENVYSTVARWIFTVSLFPGLAVIVYSEEILQIFGEGFPEGSPVLILFTLAQLANCIVGSSGYMLIMTNHQYITMFNQISSGVLNIALNYILILKFGFIGAAVATASVIAGINFLRVLQVWYFEGMYPYNRKYIKPFVAGILSLFIMYFLSLFLNQYVLLIIGGISGAITFFGILFSFGFEEEELNIIRNRF